MKKNVKTRFSGRELDFFEQFPNRESRTLMRMQLKTELAAAAAASIEQNIWGNLAVLHETKDGTNQPTVLLCVGLG